MSFLEYLHVFSKIPAKSSLKLLSTYPFAADMIAALKDDLTAIIRNTVRFGEKYVKNKYYVAMFAAVEDAAEFGSALKSNAFRIRLYIDTYLSYQDIILSSFHEMVNKMQGKTFYDHICILQSFRGAGFLSAVVRMAEMVSFSLFSSLRKLYAYFGLDNRKTIR